MVGFKREETPGSPYGFTATGPPKWVREKVFFFHRGRFQGPWVKKKHGDPHTTRHHRPKSTTCTRSPHDIMETDGDTCWQAQEKQSKSVSRIHKNWNTGKPTWEPLNRDQVIANRTCTPSVTYICRFAAFQGLRWLTPFQCLPSSWTPVADAAAHKLKKSNL